MKRLDLIGKKFGKITVLNFIEMRNHQSFWLCRCNCGKHINVNGSSLQSGNTKSCGCQKNKIPKRISSEGEASFNWLFKNYKQRAKDRGYTFELTREQFKTLTKQNCNYCD
jgi:hypothetical protein